MVDVVDGSAAAHESEPELKAQPEEYTTSLRIGREVAN